MSGPGGASKILLASGSGLSVSSGNYKTDILQAPGNASTLTINNQSLPGGYTETLAMIGQGAVAGGSGTFTNSGSAGSSTTGNGTDTGAPSSGNTNPTQAGQSAGGVVVTQVPGLHLTIVDTGINTDGHLIFTEDKK